MKKGVVQVAAVMNSSSHHSPSVIPGIAAKYRTVKPIRRIAEVVGVHRALVVLLGRIRRYKKIGRTRLCAKHEGAWRRSTVVCVVDIADLCSENLRMTA